MPDPTLTVEERLSRELDQHAEAGPVDYDSVRPDIWDQLPAVTPIERALGFTEPRYSDGTVSMVFCPERITEVAGQYDVDTTDMLDYITLTVGEHFKLVDEIPDDGKRGWEAENAIRVAYLTMHQRFAQIRALLLDPVE